MAVSDYAIEVNGVYKSFRLYDDKGHTMKEKMLHWGRNKYEVRQVLNGISFRVKKGEAVGLVGSNGCGKSTTLKLLTKIMYPDSGSIQIGGRVSSLLELGAGFHPDMSGRENIVINASIFGLNKKEITQRMDEIIDFSELKEFIDQPVRTYSSGMYMRLAFSVAINVNADVLLIDEILAVGDVNFQAKCFHRLMEIKGEGTTIVLVSHSMPQIERICDRSIWIHDGKVEDEGSPVDIHREYLSYMGKKRRNTAKADGNKEPPKETLLLPAGRKEEGADEPAVCIRAAAILDQEQKKRTVFQLGETVRLELELDARERLEDYYIEVNLVRADGLFYYGCSAALGGEICQAWEGRKKLYLTFPKIGLLAGRYHFDLHIADANGSTIYFKGNVAEFETDLYRPERGIIYMEHDWRTG